MSQPETELDTTPESIEDIAGSMGDETEVEQEEIKQEETEAEAEQVETPGADDDPEIEVEVDGKPQKVKKSEIPDLIRRGMFESDYRKKTAEAAEQRRQDDALRQELQQRQQFVASQLEPYLQALHKELIGSQPDPKLIDEDPQEFMRQQAAYNTRAQQFQQTLQYRQALSAQQEQEAQRLQAEATQRENEKLMEAMPELKDEKVRTATFSQVATYLSSAGYTQAELNGLTDHRALLVAMKAAKYDALVAAKSKQAKPEVPKPVRPGSGATTQPNTAAQKALERLRRDPNDLDALASVVG